MMLKPGSPDRLDHTYGKKLKKDIKKNTSPIHASKESGDAGFDGKSLKKENS